MDDTKPAALHLRHEFVDEWGVKTRFLTWVAPLLASIAMSGCFVLDEIDNGMDIMDEHAAAPKAKKPVEAPAGESASDDGWQFASMKDQASEWWRNALEEEPPEPDPNDIIVQCRIDGGIRFTRKSDCELRRGRMVSR